MSSFHKIVVSLLFISAVVFFIVRINLYFYLLQKNVKMVFALTSMPGYMEDKYRKLEPNLKTSYGDNLIKFEVMSFVVLVITALITVGLIMSG